MPQDGGKLPGREYAPKRGRGRAAAAAAAPPPPHESRLVPSPADDDATRALNARLAKHLRNDVGNAERFVARFGRDLLYVHDVGWHAWTGTHWSLDGGEAAAQRAAHATAVAVFKEAEAIEAEGPLRFESTKLHQARIAAHRAWASTSGNSARLAAMLREAQPYLLKRVGEMDADPWLLNVENGTLDLRPGVAAAARLRPHAPGDLITRLAPITYEPGKDAPLFGAFLDRIQTDPEIRSFLKRWFGYCMTGSIAEQCLVLFHGQGANGKSTLVELMATMLGDYGMTLPFASLLHDDRRRGSEASPDLARLPGTRFVSSGEADIGARFSESLLKSLTGGDTITARHLNHGFFEFKPQFKLCLSFNNRPSVRGQDEGIWRRLILVPFEVSIPPAERDRDLGMKLRAQAAGVLNWMIEGLEEWHEMGLAVPDAVRAATRTYREQSDPIGQFLAVAVQRAEPHETVTAKRLYLAYQGWCRASAETPISQTLFGRILGERGYVKEKIGVVAYKGIRLVNDFAEHQAQGDEPPDAHPDDPGPGMED